MHPADQWCQQREQGTSSQSQEIMDHILTAVQSLSVHQMVYLVHVAPEQLIILLEALYEPLGSNDAGLLFLVADL